MTIINKIIIMTKKEELKMKRKIKNAVVGVLCALVSCVTIAYGSNIVSTTLNPYSKYYVYGSVVIDDGGLLGNPYTILINDYGTDTVGQAYADTLPVYYQYGSNIYSKKIYQTNGRKIIKGKAGKATSYTLRLWIESETYAGAENNKKASLTSYIK